MNQNITVTRSQKTADGENEVRFFTETIEVGRISPLAFFEAGQTDYEEQLFYWQNANQTLTLVGIGHATVLRSDCVEGRFEDISNSWKRLCAALIKEEEDIAPVLFGGFSFDPQNVKNSEWEQFPSAYFVVPSFQLTCKDGKTLVSINLITNETDATAQFEQLREERDHFIHIAQVNEFDPPVKPHVLSIEERAKELYMEAVADVVEKIRDGEAEKVVIARSVKMNFDKEVSSVTALHHITSEQQESYQFGLQKGQQLFFGATPERLIEIVDGRAYSACVAGSIGRGKSAAEDRALGDELLADTKNRQEHQYVVNMISNVFNDFCTDVSLPNAPKLLKIRDIQHLFTPIEGVVEHGADIFSLVEALHPTPALGGVPTNTSMDIIRDKESINRGFYAAPIGWTDTAGNGEFAVAIRSALLDADKAYLYAGGGLVADSEVAQEYDETWVKFRPVLRALGGKLNG